VCGESWGILPRVRSYVGGPVLAASPLGTPDAYRNAVAKASQAEATRTSKPALSHGPADRIRSPREAAPRTIGGYGAGPHEEWVLRTFGPVEYVVLTVARGRRWDRLPVASH
jgi:hypothetical protein